MKFSIVILFVLGIIAAACAAVLMGIINIGTSSGQTQSQSVEVAMAKTSLRAMTVITQEHIETEMVSRNELPRGVLVSPTQILGRVLALSVVEGQILTESCFVPEGSASQLIAQIPHGMRAVTVPVSGKSMPDRALLYPGCVVDVVAVYRLSGQDSVSTTMLRGIQVIAVDDETIVSNNQNDEEKKTNRSGRGSSVTLLVDTKQAEGLLLAVQNGIISLSVRNPLDKNEFEFEGTILNPERLAELGDMLEPTVLPSLDNESNLMMEKSDQFKQELESDNQQQQGSETAVPGTVMQQQQKKQNGKYPTRKSLRWPVEVIRGRQTNVKEFEAEESESGKITPKK